MNVYDYMDLFAVAIRDAVTVKDYCIAQFKSGLIIQIDDDSETPVGSKEAPYCLLMSTPGSDDSPIAEGNVFNIRVEVGTVVQGDAPYYTETTSRSATANGLTKYGQGEKAADLLDLVITAIKTVTPSDGAQIETVSIDASGSLLFPLALAISNLTISKKQSLATW